MYDRNEEKCTENKVGNYFDRDVCDNATNDCKEKGIKNVCCPPGTVLRENYCYPEENIRIIDSQGISKDKINLSEIDKFNIVNLNDIDKNSICPDNSELSEDGNYCLGKNQKKRLLNDPTFLFRNKHNNIVTNKVEIGSIS